MSSVSWFIYVLCDPRESDPIGQVRYVGATRDPENRMVLHLKDSRRPKPRDEWLRPLLKSGMRPTLKVIEQVDAARWQDAERRWISKYRELGARLTNVTKGGMGGIGQPVQRNGGVRKVINGLWCARIYLDGKRFSLGRFKTRQEADDVRLRALDDDEFARKLIAEAPNRRRRRACHKIKRVNQHGFRGVRIDRHGSAYARIQRQGRSIDIGPFRTPEEAARAYDEKAREFWGAEAILNFP